MNEEIDIPLIIKEMIYTHDKVQIPAFGTFLSTNQTASLEVFEGVLTPPKKKLTFSETVDSDDLSLLQSIQEKYSITRETALAHLQKYVIELNKALQKKEIINIEGVGRLYLDFENKIQFYQNNTNFNTEAYGLPELNVRQVTREKDEQLIKKKQMETASFAKIKQESQGISPDKTNNTIFGFAAAFLLVLVGLIFLISLFANRNANNNKPIGNSTSGRPIVNKENKTDTVKKQITQVPANDTTIRKNEKAVDTEAITPDREVKDGIIIIGQYSKKRNAQRMIQKINNKGFEPYSDRKGKLRRVGVQFGYTTTAQLDSMLRVVRKKIHRKAWVLE